MYLAIPVAGGANKVLRKFFCTHADGNAYCATTIEKPGWGRVILESQACIFCSCDSARMRDMLVRLVRRQCALIYKKALLRIAL